MMSPPDFIDNRDGNTLARALGEILSAGKESDNLVGPVGHISEVHIVTAFFSPSGFSHIADHLRTVPSVRLLLSVDLAAPTQVGHLDLGEGDAISDHRLTQAELRRMDVVLRKQRDRLPFTSSNTYAIKQLISVLRAGNMEVRRYEKEFLHAKAYIYASDTPGGKSGGVFTGSSNLTRAGLVSNLELNLGCHDKSTFGQSLQWFNDLWNAANPYELASIFEEAVRPYLPWDIFIRVLWQLYGDEVEADIQTDQNLPLTSFQKHGVARALRLIRDTGGAIVADEVGLGKTFIAGEILELYHARRQRALLICPAALRDSTWKRFLVEYSMFAECLSYEQLANDEQLKDRQRPNANQRKLGRKLEEYQLVIVDEAHNYRNPDTPTRAAVLRTLLFGQKRDLLLLTATPVNNSLWDLYHLIRFFVRQDAHFANRGILSIRERFERAMRTDPTALSPDLLYPIIDATTVKRTRGFVKKYYSTDRIRGSDGKLIPIVFPQPRAISVHYNLDDLAPSLFDKIEDALSPDSESAITFARYSPNSFLLDESDEDGAARATAMIGLLRSGLLKRFESSVYAFRRTAEKMVREHDHFLEALDTGYVVSTAFMKEISADDELAFDEVLSGTGHKENAELYDVARLSAAVTCDRARLQALVDDTAAIAPGQDPKLRSLVKELVLIARQAENESRNAVDEAQNRKVLVFSYFADTVEWILRFLKEEVTKLAGLAPYRDRIAAVTGSGGVETVSKQCAIEGFAPVSMGVGHQRDADLYDLLVSTDVLAEGVNLQQCRHIINFDVPWNPMRLVQRHGRIDRIGSPHKRVFLRTVFPADRLDALLGLEQRILKKLAAAAASIGVAAPIESISGSQRVFTETRTEIEKLLREDTSLYERGGTAAAAQTGEEYRQTLRGAVAQGYNSIADLPRKIGSGMVKGTRRGVFFCAVARKRTYLRFVATDEGWESSRTGDAIVREVGTCLKLIECTPETPAHCPEILQDQVYNLWDVAQRDIWQEWMHETDPANLQPKIRPLNRRAAEFIRINRPSDMSAESLEKALDILESPWSRREEVMLRDWFNDEKHAGVAKSRHIINGVLGTGLEPVNPPEPLPPIPKEEIELICWLGLEPEESADTDKDTAAIRHPS